MLRKLLSSDGVRVCSRLLGIQLVVGAALAWAAPSKAAELYVGPGRVLETLRAGVAAARPNDRIVLDAGVYLDDVVTIDKPLTIEGAGRGAVLRITKPISNRKGILVVNANVTVRKITFEGAHVTNVDGKNGAGIRHQAGHLTVDTCVFSNNQNGILANANKDATVTIRRSAFLGNGGGDGYTHGIYINAVARLMVSDSSFAGTKVGHDIKSRAYKTIIEDTVLDDGVSGTPSYAVDLPNGGEAILKRIRVTQGQRTSNTSMIAYGAEGNLHTESSLTITDSAFVNRAQNAIAINNFSSVPAVVRDNTFENVGEVVRGLNLLNRSALPVLREGAIFSGLDPNTRSYFRFHNTGTSPGRVNVRLFDGRDGHLLGTWSSPQIPPNAAPQYAVTAVEAAVQVRNLPPTYTIEIDPFMTGTFQHALHRPGNGVITNLSTCAAGVTRAGTQIAGVHTSNLNSGYPASIAIQNQGPLPGSASIGIYDARQGDRLGGYVTPEIPVDGEIVVPVGVMEGAAKVVPTPEMGHWVMKIENDFKGGLQQLIANQGAGVVTDMTTVCGLNGANAVEKPVLNVGTGFPASADIESVLRVYNAGVRTAPFRVSIFDALTGARIGMWDSEPLSPRASRQLSVSGLIPWMTGDNTPRFYRIMVESGFKGFVQHLLKHSQRGTTTNISSCDAGTTAMSADVAGLRASRLEGSDVALIVAYNTGATEAVAELEAFDALDGKSLGSFATGPIPAGGNVALSVADLEAKVRLPTDTAIGAYNIHLKDGFSGLLQQLSISLHTGTVTDLTTACAVAPDSYQ